MSKRAHEPDESAVAELPEAKRARRAAGGGVDRRWITGLPELDVVYIIRPFSLKRRIYLLYTLRRVSKCYATLIPVFQRARWPSDTPIPTSFRHYCKFLKYLMGFNWPCFPMVVDTRRPTEGGWWASPIPFDAVDCIPLVDFRLHPGIGLYAKSRCMRLTWANPLSTIPIRLEETREYEEKTRARRVILRAIVGTRRCETHVEIPRGATYETASWILSVCRDSSWWDILLPMSSNAEHLRQCDLLYATMVSTKEKLAKRLAGTLH
jgi:hypothetical protein